jgi:N-acetylmuramoyl-L-alanine amidase
LNRIPIYFNILFLVLGSVSLADARPMPFRVVLDPGHGGTDEGTVYRSGDSRIAEKTLTLQLAKKVAYQLRARGYLVTLTRNDDREVALGTRTQIANRLGADIFISIHLNSSEEARRKDAEGIETYILNSTTDASSKRLARLENSVISGEQPAGSPEDRDVALILKDLRLDGNLSSSKRLACSLQEHLVRATSNRINLLRRNRGIKQALFHVLLGADMPSVLVEVGFLNSANDRSFVRSLRGQAIASRSIADAVDHYSARGKASKRLVSLNRCKVN